MTLNVHHLHGALLYCPGTMFVCHVTPVIPDKQHQSPFCLLHSVYVDQEAITSFQLHLDFKKKT